MATIYIHEGADGDGTIGTPHSVAWFNSNVAGGNTYYFIDTITTAVQFNDGGTAADPLIVRGDYAGRECTFDGQKTTNVAITLIAPDSTNIAHVYFYNFTVKDYENAGITINGPSDGNDYVEYIVIDGITTSNIGNWGESGDHDIGFGTYARRCTVRNCTLRGNGVDRGVDGIITSTDCNGSGFVFEKNNIAGHQENSIDMKYSRQSAASEGYSHIRNNTLSCTSTTGATIDIHYGTELVKVYENDITGRVGIRTIGEAGEGAGATANIHIYGNIIHGTTTYAVLDDTTNPVSGPVLFYNNTVTGGAGYVRITGKAAGSSWTFKNNIFDADIASGTTYQLRVGATSVTNGTTADYNLYGEANSAADIAYWDSGGKTLAEMRTASQEDNGAYGVVAFDSAYKPTTTNAQGTGTWLTGVRAYDDLPLPLHPDIGAVQDRDAAGRKFGVGDGGL